MSGHKKFKALRDRLIAESPESEGRIGAHRSVLLQADPRRRAPSHAVIWYWLDKCGHKIHLPMFIQRPLCDMYELSLGIYPEQLARDYNGNPPWWIRRRLL